MTKQLVIVACDVTTRVDDVNRSLSVAPLLPAGWELAVAAPVDLDLPAGGFASQTYDPANGSVSAAVNQLAAMPEVTGTVVLVAGAVIDPTGLAGLGGAESGRFALSRTYMVPPNRESAAQDALQQGRPFSEIGPGVKQAPSDRTLALYVSRWDFRFVRGLDTEFRVAAAALDDLLERLKNFGARRVSSLDVFAIQRKLNSLDTVDSMDLPSIPPGRIHANLRVAIPAAASDAPLVSVVVSTYNRGPYLNDAVNSILAQSFQDWEAIFIIDGSTDNSLEILQAYQDPRIRVIAQDNSGISVARNRGTKEARGAYIAVFDDDDIMLPWRLETQLRMMKAGDVASYGVSAHFSNETGEITFLRHRLFNLQTAVRHGNNPTHPTWLIRKDLMELFPYDESLESGVDNNVALRLVRSGVEFRHTGITLILRRIHATQITRTSGEIQRSSASLSHRLVKFASSGQPGQFEASREYLPEDQLRVVHSEVIPYLPDHLVRRRVVLHTNEIPGEVARVIAGMQTATVHRASEGECTVSEIVVEPVSWNDLAVLAEAGITGRAEAIQELESDRDQRLVWLDGEMVGDEARGQWQLCALGNDLAATLATVADIGAGAKVRSTTVEDASAVAVAVSGKSLADLEPALHLLSSTMERVFVRHREAAGLGAPDMHRVLEGLVDQA